MNKSKPQNLRTGEASIDTKPHSGRAHIGKIWNNGRLNLDVDTTFQINDHWKTKLLEHFKFNTKFWLR